jgi:probable F420-dependent oxidoreductase
MRLGIALPDGLPLRDAIEICVQAEPSGYTDVWSYEVSGYDAFTPLAAIAARTERVRLGTAVVPVSTRPPALLAMTSVAMQSISDGRFVLGLGTSTATIVNRWMGLPFPPSLVRMRETIEAIRAATAGEKVNVDGETVTIRGFRLETGPSTVPIMVGALGPGMVELAGEISDGLILTMVAPSHIPMMLDRFYAGAEMAGRKRDDLDVILTVPVLLDGQQALDGVRESLAAYGVIDVYNRHLVRQGFEVEAAHLREAWSRRSWKDAVAAVSEPMVEALSIIGNVADCRKQIAAYQAAGVKTLLVSPVVRATEPDSRRAQVIADLARLASTAEPASGQT